MRLCIQLQDDWLVPEGYLSEDEGLDAGEEGHKGESIKRSKEMKRVSMNITLGALQCRSLFAVSDRLFFYSSLILP